MNTEKINELFGQNLVAVNMGLESFAENLREHDTRVVQVAWKPPADTTIAAFFDRLEANTALDVEAANAEAVGRILSGRPTLVDVGVAGEAIPGMTKRTVLHAGPSRRS